MWGSLPSLVDTSCQSNIEGFLLFFNFYVYVLRVVYVCLLVFVCACVCACICHGMCGDQRTSQVSALTFYLVWGRESWCWPLCIHDLLALELLEILPSLHPVSQQEHRIIDKYHLTWLYGSWRIWTLHTCSASGLLAEPSLNGSLGLGLWACLWFLPGQMKNAHAHWPDVPRWC